MDVPVNLVLDLVKFHGVPTLIIMALIYVAVKHWIPMKEREIAAAQAAETQRLENQAAHDADLVAEIRLAREEGRAERERMHQDQRAAEDRQYNAFREMVNTIKAGLDANTHELRRNSALTVASAEILGAQKLAVEKRAGELAPEAKPR